VSVIVVDLGWQLIDELPSCGQVRGFAMHDATLDDILSHDPIGSVGLWWLDGEKFLAHMQTYVWGTWPRDKRP
jgi:hypothetical protein